MKGNAILISNQTEGRFDEGWIVEAALPGSLLEEVPGHDGGKRKYYRKRTGALGNKKENIVLLDDPMQGRPPTQAYVAGDRCFTYTPAAGEELNLLVSVLGTGTGSGISGAENADLISNSGGTGTLIGSSGSPASVPFRAQERIDDVLGYSSVLTWVRCTGY